MNIEEICNRLLDNADVTVDFSCFPKVTLTFAVIGTVDSSYWEVVFVLDSVFELHVDMEAYEEATPHDSHMVLEAMVKRIEHDGNEAFFISIGHGGDFNFSAKAIGFTYQANAFDKSEFRNKYEYLFAGRGA